jgi:hypothetical protein
MITNYRSPAICIAAKASTLLCLSSRRNGALFDHFMLLILVECVFLVPVRHLLVGSFAAYAPHSHMLVIVTNTSR